MSCLLFCRRATKGHSVGRSMKPYYVISVVLSILALVIFTVLFFPSLNNSGGGSVYSLAGYFTTAVIAMAALLLNSTVASLVFWRYGYEGYARPVSIAHLVLVVGLVMLVFDLAKEKPSHDIYQELSAAAVNNNAVAVKQILEQGAVSKELRLKIATYNVKQNNVLDLFLRDDPSLLHPLFCYAIDSGEYQHVVHYLKRGANVEKMCSKFGVKPVFLVQSGTILRTLVKAGMRLDVRGEHSDSAFSKLIYVAQLEDELSESDLIFALKSQPTIAAMSSSDGSNPLMLAVRSGFMDLAHSLVETGVNVNQTTQSGETAMFLADNARMIRFLMQNGANINHQNLDGKTPVSFFVAHGKGEAAIELIKAGADLGLKDQTGSSALDYLQRPNNPLSMDALMKIESLIARN